MSSIIKVDTIQNQSGANIISESANTITVGASGDTITVPSGATLGGAGAVDLSSATVTLNDTMKNSPFMFAKGLTSSQAISNQTFTTLTNYNTPTKSTQGTFSSGIYTPGIAGTYFVYMMADIGNLGDTDRSFCRIESSEDGSTWTQQGATGKDINGHPNADVSTQTSFIFTCTANTQIRTQAWHEYGSDRNHQNGAFIAFKIVG